MTAGTQELKATIAAIPIQAWLFFIFDLDYVKFAKVSLTSIYFSLLYVAYEPFRGFQATRELDVFTTDEIFYILHAKFHRALLIIITSEVIFLANTIQ